jgi:aubergine
MTLPRYRVQIWPGFITSTRQHEQDILLNFRLTHKIIREENLLRILGEILGDCGRNGGDYKSAAKQKIIGTTVMTNYNNQTYKVSDIDFNNSPASTFDSQGKPESYASYYERKYQLEIKDMKQPLLLVKPTAKNIRGGKDKPILLVPELCNATGMTDNMMKDRHFTTEMAGMTRMTPQEYLDRTCKNMRRLLMNPGAVSTFEQNQVALDSHPVEVESQRLEKEELLFGENRLVKPDDGDWTKHLQTNRMYKTVDLKNWHFVYPEQSEATMKDFMHYFKHVTTGLRMPVEEPRMHKIQNTKGAYESALQQIVRQDPFFIMVIVTRPMATEMYKIVKRQTLCFTPQVPCQVISEDTWRTRKSQAMSVATKIAVQVNCKIGGIPWKVNLRLSGIMIVGFDSSHDTRNKKKCYGAMVASLNPNREDGGHYYSAVNQHENGQQLSEHLGCNIIAALRRYNQLNSYGGENVLPGRILIYRDGVGDGQVRK